MQLPNGVLADSSSFADGCATVQLAIKQGMDKQMQHAVTVIGHSAVRVQGQAQCR